MVSCCWVDTYFQKGQESKDSRPSVTKSWMYPAWAFLGSLPVFCLPGSEFSHILIRHSSAAFVIKLSIKTIPQASKLQ